jgi:hypothetical protein
MQCAQEADLHDSTLLQLQRAASGTCDGLAIAGPQVGVTVGSRRKCAGLSEVS